jgi:hypothetical protein
MLEMKHGNTKRNVDVIFTFLLDLLYDESIMVKKGKVTVLNELSTMPCRHIGELKYSSTILDLSTRCR